MGNIAYFFKSIEPIEVGKGSNLNEISGLKDVKINQVTLEGPFDKATDETEKVLISDFWKDQTVVIHLLRRFG